MNQHTQIKRGVSDNWWKSFPLPSTCRKESEPSFEDYTYFTVADMRKTWHIYFLPFEAVTVLRGSDFTCVR